MTDKPEQQLDPNEKRVIVATNAQIGNLIQCVDLMRRNCNIEQVKETMELFDLLSTAEPVQVEDDVTEIDE